jgi:hypothetical protein
VNVISGDAPKQAYLLSPQRALGRICSELDYPDIQEVLDQNMHPYLDRLLLRINQAGIEITRTYFNTQVILPSRYPTGQQQAQQQQ